MNILWGNLEDWFRFTKNPPIATPTIVKYRRTFYAVKPFFDEHGWNSISVLKFVKMKKDQGLKNKSINDYAKFFRHIDAFMGTDCTKVLRRLTEEDVYFDVLTRQELDAILSCEVTTPYSWKNKRLYTVLYMLLSEMALRIEEALAIKWADWKGDYITIFATKTNRYDDLLITTQLQTALAELPRDDERIFPLTRPNVSTELKRRCQIMGIQKKVSPHTFRRSFATIGLEAGLQEKWIQEKGRWKSANSMDKYIRKSKRHQRTVLSNHPFTADRMTIEEKITYAYELRRKYEDDVRTLNLPREELEKLLLIKSL